MRKWMRCAASIPEKAAITPTEELLSLPLLQPENIKDTLHAYQLAKRCNEKRVMYTRSEAGAAAGVPLPVQEETRISTNFIR